MTTDLNGEPSVVVNHNKRTAVRLSLVDRLGASTSSLKDTLVLIKCLKNKHRKSRPRRARRKIQTKQVVYGYGLRSLIYPVLPNEKDDNNNNKLCVPLAPMMLTI
jgi:hypothetical protein